MDVFDATWRNGPQMQDWQLGKELKDAYKAIKDALGPHIEGPSSRPDLDAYLHTWETSAEISARIHGAEPPTREALVDEMIYLIRFVSSSPNVNASNRDIIARLTRIGDRIQEILLQQARINQREKSNTSGDLEANDISLLREWGEEIHTEVLGFGEKSRFSDYWMCNTLPRIFDHLETFNELSCSMLWQSKLPLVLQAIIKAPCIPHIWCTRSIRDRSKELLSRWSLLPEVLALSKEDRIKCGLEVELDEVLPANRRSIPILYADILYHPQEITQTVGELEKAAVQGNLQEVERLVATIKEWGWLQDQGLVYALIVKLSKIIRELEKASARSGSTDNALFSLGELQDALRQNRAGCRGVTGLSYVDGPPESVISLCFRDAASMSSNPLPPDEPSLVSSDIFVTCSLHAPLQLVLEKFVNQFNSLNRHPLSPATAFMISSSTKMYEIVNGKPVKVDATVFQVNDAKFIQGRVSSIHFTQHYVLYYNHHGSGIERSHQMRQFATHRKLPLTIASPPDHWCKPSPPAGPEADWDLTNSMAFISDDLWPRAIYPQIIASHIYIPKNIENLYSGRRDFRNRGPVRVDVSPLKIFPPLSKDQAQSLVGLTIQYEEFFDPMEAIQEQAGEKRQRRDMHTLSGNVSQLPDWDRVFIAFVWGFDPERMVLKVFENFRTADISRSIVVGSAGPLPFKSVYISTPNPQNVALQLPFVPKWLGAVRAGSSESQTPRSTPEPTASDGTVEDRLSVILKKAPRRFEVGIGGDCAVLVGELTLHDPASSMIETVENCKAGIWESGCVQGDKPGDQVLIWIQWVDDGSIDLKQPVEAFENINHLDRSLPLHLPWARAGIVSVDGGMISVMARGITGQTPIAELMDKETTEITVMDIIRTMALLAAEDDFRHFPCGICVGTGSDGTFSVQVARDDAGKAIAVKASGPLSANDSS